jgi:sec-independent protein translocase protein TatC
MAKSSAIRGAGVVGARYLRSKRAANPDGRMPLIDHLRELRNRVLKIALAVLAGSVVGWIFYARITTFIQQPFCYAVQGCSGKTGHFLQMIGVLDPIYFKFKIAIFAGIILTSPVWLYQIWAFIAPGLYRREKKWSYSFVGIAVPLFAAGCVFAYVAMQQGLRFIMDMAPVGSATVYTWDSYLGYWIAMVLAFGACFEVPLFLVMLNLARILPHAVFKKWRRLIIFLIFVAAGIASPSPDPTIMLLLGGSIIVLVEIAELIMWLSDRRYARKHPNVYENLDDSELSTIEEPETVDQ